MLLFIVTSFPVVLKSSLERMFANELSTVCIFLKLQLTFSLMGVREPPAFPTIADPLGLSRRSRSVRGWRCGGDTGVVCQKKAENLRIGHFSLSLSLSGFKCTHILQQSPTVSCPSLRSFPPSECRTASCIYFFEAVPPSPPFVLPSSRFCAQVWTFFFPVLLSFGTDI